MRDSNILDAKIRAEGLCCFHRTFTPPLNLSLTTGGSGTVRWMTPRQLSPAELTEALFTSNLYHVTCRQEQIGGIGGKIHPRAKTGVPQSFSKRTIIKLDGRVIERWNEKEFVWLTPEPQGMISAFLSRNGGVPQTLGVYRFSYAEVDTALGCTLQDASGYQVRLPGEVYALSGWPSQYQGKERPYILHRYVPVENLHRYSMLSAVLVRGSLPVQREPEIVTKRYIPRDMRGHID